MTDLSDLLTVPEAAKVAGVSERTMRRWVTNGQDGHEKRSPERTASATSATGTAVAVKADRLADLSATAAMWQARAGMLEYRVLALEAPKEQPASAVESVRRRTTRLLVHALAALAALLLALATAPAWHPW